KANTTERLQKCLDSFLIDYKELLMQILSMKKDLENGDSSPFVCFPSN
ncbi:unnamed protein product, partial [Brachionus calyciflorus]